MCLACESQDLESSSKGLSSLPTATTVSGGLQGQLASSSFDIVPSSTADVHPSEPLSVTACASASASASNDTMEDCRPVRRLFTRKQP